MFEEPTPEMIALIEQMYGTIPQPPEPKPYELD